MRTRKLIYEGELEWKINHSIKQLTALLYQDILVLLERSTDEKRRYILKPLTYLQNKSKQIFTPVIPLIWIESFKPMQEKRLFHLVAIIRDHKETRESSTSLLSKQISSSQIQNQILFIFVAKSGDERNKWCTYLQELTGRMSQLEKQGPMIDLSLNRQQSSASSLLSHSASNAALSATLSSTISSGLNTLNGSLSSSALSSNLQFAPLNVSLNSNNNNEQTNKQTSSVSTNAQVKEQQNSDEQTKLEG